MSRHTWLNLWVWLLVGLAYSSPLVAQEIASGQPPFELEAVDGGISYIDAEGKEQWRHVHGSLWPSQEAFDAREEAVDDVPLIALEERYFYAVRSDLLEVEAATGLVHRRTRYPATISSLEIADEGLWVTLAVEFERSFRGQKSANIRVLHKFDGAAPSQTTWDPSLNLSASLDSARLAANAEAQQEKREAIQRLEEAANQDLTNPFYAFEAGELYRQLGEDQKAAQAFEAAAATPGAVWSDLLFISTLLEAAEAPKEATLANAKGVEKMEALGISPPRLISAVSMIITFMHTGQEEGTTIKSGVADGDVEVVHRLSRRLAEVFPNVEGGAMAWAALANWMNAQGRQDLAHYWREQAQANHLEVGDLFTARAQMVDLSLLILLASGLGLMILCFLIGLRGSLLKKSRRGPEAASKNKQPWWIPELRLRDVGSVLVIGAIFVGAAFAMNFHLLVLYQPTSAPLVALSDGMASPEMGPWLAQYGDTPEAHQLAAIAEAEQQALVEGTMTPEKERIAPLVLEMVTDDIRRKIWTMMVDGQWPDFVVSTTLLTSQEIADESHLSLLSPLAYLLLAGILFILYAVGVVIGLTLPRFSRWCLVVVPGAAPALAPIGGLLLVLLLAALLAFLGYDSVVYLKSARFQLTFFGLDGLLNHVDTPSRIWAWIALPAVVAIHIGVLFIARDDLLTEGGD